MSLPGAKRVAVLLFLLVATPVWSQSDNPPLPGFDEAGSDPRAIEIADRVMAKLGGRQNWDGTRYVTWNFFGRRTHVWDKHTGALRFENEDLVVLMNLNTLKGRAFKAGQEIEAAEELAETLNRAHGAWINDSYWMFMPFKLKDSGVTLKYVGERTTEAGEAAEVVELTFKDVGRTPQNRYHVYMDKETDLVTQWDYYQEASDPEPRFKVPWKGWTPHGRLLLSADRGERQHQNVAVFDELPESVFVSPEPVDIIRFKK